MSISTDLRLNCYGQALLIHTEWGGMGAGGEYQQVQDVSSS